MVRDGFVQFELHATQPVEDVSVLDSLDEHLPGVCVIGRHTDRAGIVRVVEGTRSGAVYEGSEDLNPLDTLARRRCHRRGSGVVLKRRPACKLSRM